LLSYDQKGEKIKISHLEIFLAPMLGMRQDEELHLVALKKTFKSVLEEDGSEYDHAFCHLMMNFI